MQVTAGERQRILLCRQTSPDMTLRELCHYYMINRDHAAIILGEHFEATNPATTRKRIDHHQAGERYATANVYQEITVAQLAQALEVSEPTARKVIDARPDCYRKLRRGVWECRDANADRKAEKGN